MKTLITFRLRKQLDADLIAVDISDEDLPELCRNGLRLMLGIRSTKHVEVKERPLAVPQAKEKTIQLPSKPTVFTPKNQRPMS